MLELKSCIFTQGTFRLSADWTLPMGARLAVIGPSGAGKSTLLAGIAGFTENTEGHVALDGVTFPNSPAARPVAMLFQDHNLFPHLSIAQNVGLGLRPTTRLTPDEATQVETALSDVGLAGLGTRIPSELSGGQQSRAALARVLVMARPVILLDEPFAALGPAQRVEMLSLVTDLAARLKATVLMVTHDPTEARALDGHVCFVEDGTAQEPVTAQTFFESPPDGAKAYIGQG